LFDGAPARLLAGVAALGFLSILTFADVTPRIRQVDDRPVVLSVKPCVGDQDSGASGIVVADEQVLTVAHAIVEAAELFVRDRDDVWRRATVQHLDRDRDLAVLEVVGLRATDMAVATAQRGDHVTMVQSLTTGTASGQIVRRVNINTASIGSDVVTSRRGYEVGIGIDPGDSGAGVVDDRDRLIGIVFAEPIRRDGAAWVTDVSAVPDVLGGRVAMPSPC